MAESNRYSVNITCPRCQFRGDVEEDFPCGHDAELSAARQRIARLEEALNSCRNAMVCAIGDIEFGTLEHGMRVLQDNLPEAALSDRKEGT